MVSVKADSTLSKFSKQNEPSKKLFTVKKCNSRNTFLNCNIFLISAELRTLYQKVAGKKSKPPKLTAKMKFHQSFLRTV